MPPGSERYDFFIAHAGADRAVAERLYDLLREAGRAAFVDSRCLDLGDDWDAALADAQRISDVSVVLVSEMTGRAYYQREEIAAAIDLARRDPYSHRVVPVYLDGAPGPATSVPYGLQLKHGIALYGAATIEAVATRLCEMHARRFGRGRAAPAGRQAGRANPDPATTVADHSPTSSAGTPIPPAPAISNEVTRGIETIYGRVINAPGSTFMDNRPKDAPKPAAASDPSGTVFVSYRREVSWSLARLVFQDLRAHGYDVFMDVESIDAGEFERVILTQIDARAHFIVILEPGSLDRIAEPDDWLRREIARAIASDRNVVPMTAGGLRLDRHLSLPHDIDRLAGFLALDVPVEYYGAAMEKLRDRFLKRPAPAVTPAPAGTEAAVSRKIEHAIDPPDAAVVAGLAASATTVGGGFRAGLAPQLSGEPFPGGAALSWSTILLASEYTLERGLDQRFTNAAEVYRGPSSEYRDTPLVVNDWHYRVRARTVLAVTEGPWSEPVVIRPERARATESPPAAVARERVVPPEGHGWSGS